MVDGVTGLVVAYPEDPGSVAEALRTLLADPKLRKRMGRAARARAREFYDYDVLASRLASTLEKWQADAPCPTPRPGSTREDTDVADQATEHMTVSASPSGALRRRGH